MENDIIIENKKYLLSALETFVSQIAQEENFLKSAEAKMKIFFDGIEMNVIATKDTMSIMMFPKEKEETHITLH